MVSRILLLLILTSSVYAGISEMNQIQSFYEAVENQNITLEWTFTDRRPLQNYDITCEHYNDVRGAIIFHMQRGFEIPQIQYQDFKGRVQFDEDAFGEGRFRLTLSRLQTEDSGVYKCQMNTRDEHISGTCRLNVSAAANETPTLRPGPVEPGPETNLATCVTCVPFGVFILLSLLL